MVISELLGKAYSERQYINIAEDSLVKAQREAEDKQNSKQENIGKLEVTSFIKDILKIYLSFNLTYIIAEEAINHIISAINKARTNGINVVTISRTEAQQLKLPPGHPRDRVIYVGHPAVPDTYYTMAEFHKKTFEHKFSEAIKLLMSLGAKKLEVEHITGWSSDFAADIGAADMFNAKAKISKNNKSKILFTADLINNTSKCLPDDMVWYPHEPAWRSIAEGRLLYGMNTFSLLLNYNDDFGINAELKTKLKGYGFDLGGNFENHQSTTWNIKGEF